ncbi:MAG: hypothetical protein HRF45_13000 [Fimbriimonadia bacterium]|jgi:hypothetical protein
MNRAIILVLLGCLAQATPAVNVGIFDNSRLLGPSWNIETAGQLSQFRTEWQNRGAVWQQTSSLTSTFLNGVSVFVTSKISTQNLGSAEKTALVNWVQAGGTLVVTAECNCYNNQTAYNSMLALFGFVLSGTIAEAYGSVVGSHPITQGVTSPYIGQNGHLALPDGAQRLIVDQLGNDCAAVLEGSPIVGLGRVFVIGDCDMFIDFFLTLEEQNLKLVRNLANWAMNPTVTLYGTVSLADYVGPMTGMPLELWVYQDGVLVDSLFTWLEDEAGSYTFTLPGPGTYTLRCKAWHWLSVLKPGVTISGPTAMGWHFPYNGDVWNDNAIDIADLNMVLVDFAKSGFNLADANGNDLVDLLDLNIVLINFARVGQ